MNLVKYCETCGKEIDETALSEYATGRFCCKVCAQQSRKKLRYCKNCGKLLTKRGNQFCDSKCFHEFKYNQVIQQWKQGDISGTTPLGELANPIRTYMLKKANYQCERCGWHERNPFTQNIPLTIHHIDGNWQNNSEDNLQVLCPNCHSLTENYCSLNIGNGRLSRRKNEIEKRIYEQLTTEKITKVPTNICPICGKAKSRKAKTCRECMPAQKTVCPSKEQLIQDLNEYKCFLRIGKKYNVSDNAVRKWCKKYNLPTHTKDIINKNFML